MLFIQIDCGDNCGVCLGNNTRGCDECEPGYYLKSNNTCAGEILFDIFKIVTKVFYGFHVHSVNATSSCPEIEQTMSTCIKFAACPAFCDECELFGGSSTELNCLKCTERYYEDLADTTEDCLGEFYCLI